MNEKKKKKIRKVLIIFIVILVSVIFLCRNYKYVKSKALRYAIEYSLGNGATNGNVSPFFRKASLKKISHLEIDVIYDDKGIQVRIRTEDMNRKNALGVISNWNSNTQEVVRQMSKALIDLEKRDLSTDQFIDEAKESFLHMKGD